MRMSQFQSVQPLISATRLSEVVNDASVCIFDCRFQLSDSEYGRNEFGAGHIPGAMYVHLDEHLSGAINDGQQGRHPLPDVDMFMRKMNGCGVSDSSLVIAYDDAGGPFAARLWWLLHWIGHRSVSVLDGGWSAWKAGAFNVELSDQSSTTAPRDVHSDLTLKLNPSLRTPIEDIYPAQTFSNLVDSRARERYLGENEPIDPVAGHIPGSLNRPWMDNLNENGIFLDPAVLRHRFESLYGNNLNPVFYCGSGVTGCHNILATQVAGLPMPTLFAESWSGWISDPSRAIALGV